MVAYQLNPPLRARLLDCCTMLDDTKLALAYCQASTAAQKAARVVSRCCTYLHSPASAGPVVRPSAWPQRRG